MKKNYGEAFFDLSYLLYAYIIGFIFITRSGNNPTLLMFGALTLTLAFGDMFHLIPRILICFGFNKDLDKALGYGKMITSITMTLFYVILYYIYTSLSSTPFFSLAGVIIILATAIRIILTLLPQNNWKTNRNNPKFNMARNIPFFIIGLITIVLFFTLPLPFKQIAFAVLGSFLFYAPVAFYVTKMPKLGLLMIPKTLCYVWIISLGFLL